MDSASIDLLIKACDKAVQLLGIRAERHKRFLLEVIDPIYEKLKPVVSGYHKFFVDSELLLIDCADGNKKRKDVVKILHASRNDFIIAREEVRALAAALWSGKSNPKSAVDEFAESIHAIFYSNHIDALVQLTPMDGASRASGVIVDIQRTSSIAEGWDHIDLFDASAKYPLLAQIQTSKLAIEISWERATRAYARLKLEQGGY